MICICSIRHLPFPNRRITVQILIYVIQIGAIATHGKPAKSLFLGRQYVDGQTCFGLDKLVLNNNYADATSMKEALVYDMYQYLDAWQTSIKRQ